MAKNYGWRPDPRFKVAHDGTQIDLLAQDKKFPELVAALNMKAGSGDVSLQQYCIAMDQGSLAACTGNATDESLEILENIAHGNAELLSRLFTYAMARTEDGTLSVDGGSYVRSCFDTLSRFGVCTEAVWPYDPTKVCVSPSIQAQQQAVGHKITGYYRIVSTGDQLLTDIQTALYNNHPVVFGTQVGTDFENLTGSLGPIDVPAASTIQGGHALVVVGYIGGLYLIHNSWGTDWGQGGFCLFTPAYMTWAQTSDLWVPTISPIFTP